MSSAIRSSFACVRVEVDSATVILAILVEPAEARVHSLHLFAFRVKGVNRKMHFRLQKTFADATGAERAVELGLSVAHHLLDGCLTPGAPLKIDIQITARTDGCAPVCLGLRYKFATRGDPASESFQSSDNIIEPK